MKFEFVERILRLRVYQCEKRESRDRCQRGKRDRHGRWLPFGHGQKLNGLSAKLGPRQHCQSAHVTL